MGTLFDYLDNPIIFLDDWSAVKESYTTTMWQHHKDIEQLLGLHVNLKLWVKVRPDWRNRMVDLRNLGYDSK